MKECKKYKPLFDRALYDELSAGEKEEFYAHLGNCSECSKEFNELKALVTLTKTSKTDEPEPEFLESLWSQIEPELTRKESSFVSFLKEISGKLYLDKRWSYQLAAAFTLLVLGIFIGKAFFTGGQGKQDTVSSGQIADHAIVEARTERYIDRSKVLLLGLMNFDPESDDAEGIDLSAQQKISDQLVTEAEGLKNDLKTHSDRQLLRLVEDIETVLRQIANLELEDDIDGIELVKTGVERKGIFLKINIEEMKKGVNKIATEQKDLQDNNGKSI